MAKQTFLPASHAALFLISTLWASVLATTTAAAPSLAGAAAATPVSAPASITASDDGIGWD